MVMFCPRFTSGLVLLCLWWLGPSRRQSMRSYEPRDWWCHQLARQRPHEGERPAVSVTKMSLKESSAGGWPAGSFRRCTALERSIKATSSRSLCSHRSRLHRRTTIQNGLGSVTRHLRQSQPSRTLVRVVRLTRRFSSTSDCRVSRA